MIKHLAWSMFKNTGNIEFYMQYRDTVNNKTDFSMEAGSETIVDGEKWHTLKPRDWLQEK